MTGFIRPELRWALHRWREALIGGAVALAGLWWLFALATPVAWIGMLLIGAGAAMMLTGVQRGRLRGDGEGPGLVQVDEAEVTYFGPLDGGAVALDALVELRLDPTGKPLHWVLIDRDGWRLHIPTTAKGADALFDAFAQLPGFRTEAALRQLSAPSDRAGTVWRRDGGQGATVISLSPRTKHRD